MTKKLAIQKIPPNRITDDELVLMTPDHPKWGKFCRTLGGLGYCNFHKETWSCYSDHRYARQLLPMFGADVEGSIKFQGKRGLLRLRNIVEYGVGGMSRAACRIFRSNTPKDPRTQPKVPTRRVRRDALPTHISQK
jgi:hypothetical protein